jgi:3-phenylpropionate/trans-cinnamate dioxygenase ferredoxin subunit
MIRACLDSELEPGASLTVEHDGLGIAIFRGESGKLYATQDSCTHEQWSLGTEGEVEGEEVLCPLHLARYDLATGKPLCFPATLTMKTFAVKVDDEGVVWVDPAPQSSDAS